MDRWRGKVAVVTGASEGIGEAVVRRLAKHGMKVAALARRANLLQALEEDVNKATKSPGLVRGRACDVSDQNQVEQTFEWIEKNMGPVSVLVNNAAVFTYTLLSDMDINAVKPQIDVNILGVLYCTQQCIKSMKKNGINDGHIINVNSLLAHRDVGINGLSIYTASKQALTTITASLKRELAEEKMKTRVTSLSPGLVKTSMSNWFTKEHPEHDCLSAEDVVDTLQFALSAPSTVNISEVIFEAA